MIVEIDLLLMFLKENRRLENMLRHHVIKHSEEAVNYTIKSRNVLGVDRDLMG